MSPVYINKAQENGTRKFMADMAYLSSHKKIRLPKYYFEEGLYIQYYPDPADKNIIEKYFLEREKSVSEDENFYYFIRVIFYFILNH